MRWVTSPPPPSTIEYAGSPLIAQALTRRGLTTDQAVRSFLNPSLYSPSPASELPGIPAAVERLLTAIRKQENICVWGDFDVDGQTSTALLVQTLGSAGAQVTYTIPIRANMGHGLHLPKLNEIISQGVSLVLTCDTGISAHAAVELCHSRQVDMIITDHHDLPTQLPDALAVIDPKMLPAGHPLASLAGVGVAYKLAESLLQSCTTGVHPHALLDLVALGLVADLAALVADARYLAQLGIEKLRSGGRLGLQCLYEAIQLAPETLNESHIGFSIAPHLNAIGRLGDANPIVDLFLTEDPSLARVLVNQLESYNAQRRLLTNQVIQAVEARFQADPALLASPILIVGHTAWPGGILGLAASHLVERYGKPALVYTSPPGEITHGSARSVPGVNITALISAQVDLLSNFGGHPMAAGFSLPPENLPAFIHRAQAEGGRLLAQGNLAQPVLEIDACLTLPELTDDIAAEIETLAPFGPGNPKLVLATRDLFLKKETFIGKDKDHRKLIVADSAGTEREVLWWNGGSEVLPAGRFDLAYTYRTSHWHGKEETQLEFIAFQENATSAPIIRREKHLALDYRHEPDPLAILDRARADPSVFLWVEGSQQQPLGGKDRTQFAPSDTLLLWTIPPSPADLASALASVQPRNVWLVAHLPPEQDSDFITRLTGLVKFALGQPENQVQLSKFAADTCQSTATVRVGLTWLASKGHFSIEKEVGDLVWLCANHPTPDPSASAVHWRHLQSLLTETAAYRAYFRRAPLSSLFPE